MIQPADLLYNLHPEVKTAVFAKKALEYCTKLLFCAIIGISPFSSGSVRIL